MTKIYEAFAGIGASSKALSNLGIDFEIVGYAEIDKHASKSFSLIHNISESLNDKDIKEVKSINGADLFTFGSPCQDFSVAGRGRGGEKDSETRSALIWEAVRVIELNRPKYIMFENVKAILNKNHIEVFEEFCDDLKRIGYNISYEVLNAVDFGVPQNRERVFLVGALDGEPLDFSKLKRKETKPLNEYVNFESMGYDFTLDTLRVLTNDDIKRISNWKAYEKPLEKIMDENSIRPTITTRSVYNTSSMKIIEFKDCEEKWGKFVNTGSKTSKVGYFGRDYLDKRVYDTSTPIPTICTSGNPLYTNYKTLAVLGELEALRLMGFSDNDYLTIKNEVNKTQIFKQAGNSIVVDVLMSIFEEHLKEK